MTTPTFPEDRSAPPTPPRGIQPPPFNPLADQIQRNAEQDDERHPLPAPSIQRVSIPEVEAERQRELETGVRHVDLSAESNR
jgi:hypothetical protein